MEKVSHDSIISYNFIQFHKFPGKVGEKMYSGYDYNNWTLRDNDKHRKHCEKIRRAKSDKERSDLESEHGCRYSVLLELDYFNVIRQTPIDAMHNLFLGIAKAFFELLVNRGILTDLKMAMITSNLEIMFTNSSKSWLPKNIGSHWRFFNASEWKQWVLIYSLPAFRGVIPIDYLKTWSLFVNACQLICKPCVSKSDVNKAHNLLCNYVKQLQRQFGKEVIKPNHHMSLHLKECIEDFGGVYTTWLFSFERFNGFLGDYQTNNKGIEVTLMRKIIVDSILANRSFDLPQDFFKSCSLPPIKQCIFKPGDVKHLSMKHGKMSQMPIMESSLLWAEISHITVPSVISGPTLNPMYLKHIDEDDLCILYDMYKCLYPNKEFDIDDLSKLTKKFDTIHFGSERFYCGSNNNQSKLCLILAKWCNDEGCIDGESAPRLGLIKYFLLHNTQISGQLKSHILCAVQWYSHFHDTLPTNYLSPVQVFRKKSVKPGPASFMPVQRILHKCAYSIREVNKFANCIVVSPVQFDVYI